MAVLRGLDGTFYELPDGEVKNYEVPREKVKALLEKHGLPVQSRPGPTTGRGGGAPHGGPSPVVVQIHTPAGYAPHAGAQPHAEGGEVDPYWWWWNNWGNY